MSIHAALHKQVADDAAVTALVGNEVYQGKSPQTGNEHRVVHHLLTRPRTSHLNGRSGLTEVEFQIDVYAPTGGEREAITEAVTNALEVDGPAVWFGSVEIRRCWVVNERDEFPDEGDGRETVRFRTRMEVTIWYIR